MNENNKQIILNKAVLLPIGIVIVILGAVVSFVWSAAVLRENVSNNKLTIGNLQTQISSMPSQTEYDTLRADITEIKTDLKTLLRENK